MTELPKLTVEMSGAAAIELALCPTPLTPDEESFRTVTKKVFAERNASFSMPLAGLERAAVTLRVNGTVVGTTNRIEGDTLRLIPREPGVFSEICGFAEISLFISRGETGRTEERFAEPVLVCFREGPIADNILKMADEVVSRWGDMFTEEGALNSATVPGTGRKTEERLKRRLKLLADIVLLYESHLAFFAASGRTALKDVNTVESFERLTDFTEETAQYIVSHPEELMIHRGKAGIMIGEAAYMPRHTLVHTVQPCRDTPENRAVASFPLTVAEALRGECRRIRKLVEGFGDGAAAKGYVAPGLAVVNEAGRRLSATLETLERIERRLRMLAGRAAEIFGLRPALMRGMPQPTPAFLSIAPYRMVWNAMKAWFGRPDIDYEAQAALIVSVERSSLYEYFVFFRLIDALKANGFEMSKSCRHLWGNAGSLYNQTAHENTCVFKRAETTVTLWFQPVIAGHHYTGENGLLLKRRTSWSMQEGGESGVSMQKALNAYYTPDYVLKIEEGGKARYALLDAKLSSVEGVLMKQLPFLSFRYLTSVGTVRREDRHLGLWLICGLPGDGKSSAHLFDLGNDSFGSPDIRFLKLTALDKDPLREAVAGILCA